MEGGFRKDWGAKKTSASNELTEEESRLAAATVLVDALTKETIEACKASAEEDNTRELYSLVESIDKVKLPSFEGRDFSK